MADQSSLDLTELVYEYGSPYQITCSDGVWEAAHRLRLYETVAASSPAELREKLHAEHVRRLAGRISEDG